MQTAIGHYRKDQNTDYMNFYAFIEHLLRYTDAKIPSEALKLLHEFAQIQGGTARDVIFAVFEILADFMMVYIPLISLVRTIH